jgi:general secretion pathway protein D
MESRRFAALAMSPVRVVASLLLTLTAGTALAQDAPVVTRGDSVTIRLVEVDLRQAVQLLSQYLNRPIVFGSLAPQPVTIETPRPIHRSQVLPLLRSMLEGLNHELVDDSTGGVWQVRSRSQATPQSESQSQRQAGVPELFVIRLTHARASDVAATVNALYGRAGALGERDAPPETLGNQLRQNLVPPGDTPSQAVIGAAGRVAALQGDVTIVPDAGTNSLLIRAARSDFELIQAAVQEVDVRPLQVLIEVTIAELRRDRSWSFGVGSELGETRVGGTTVKGSIEGGGLGDLVLRAMNIGGSKLNAILTASAARGDARILSRPVVLAANNEEAVINVGSQRPFIQVSRSLPTDAPSRDQVVQYKDVGTNLTVRPTISSNGYVTLEVSQEVNAATNETAFDAPVISTRSVRTQLLVRDSQTVILGGLSDTQREELRGGVPVLSGIPLLGGLFGRQQKRSTSTELFLFLTIRVIRSDDEAAAVTEPARQQAERGRP